MDENEQLFSNDILHGNIINLNIEEEMKSSYIEYSMSVIISRALPDVRDGLKPVHRRILYAMHEQGMVPNRPYKKSARLVGEVLGKYHPHGDTAVYDAMVRMAQDFSMRYPLVDGQGNFGSVDGDSAAAMRYTEARMSKISTTILEDLEKETVPFVPNFDESLNEPSVMPSRLPNLLLNGASGIAVGMATNIPPHQLGELIDALSLLIDQPDSSIDDLMVHVKGPDFPTGGIICGKEGIYNAYHTGKGHIIVRAKIHTEQLAKKKDREALIVTELPYQVNKANLIMRIADLVKDKKIVGITNLRDESDRKGMRIYIELRKDANPDVILNLLYKHTPLQSTFGANILAIVEGVPRVLNLKDALSEYLKHREDVITKRTIFDLKKAKERAHIVEGLRIALNHLDAVIALIRASKTVEEARQGLKSSFSLSDLQAQAILEMRLQKLTGLEREKLESEYQALLATITDLQDILDRRDRVLTMIKNELLDIKAQFNDKRRTSFGSSLENVDLDDLIPEDTIAIFLTKQGFIKRVSIEQFKSQGRGGRGVSGMETRGEDTIDQILVVSTHTYLMCFTNFGKAYRFKAYNAPDASKAGMGRSISTLLNLAKGEEVRAMIPIDDFTEENAYLMMATIKGVIKKTAVKEFQHLRNKEITAIKLDEDDDLFMVRKTSGTQDVLLTTLKGMLIRFPETDVRSMGRVSRGVKGLKLKKDDHVVGFDVVDDNSTLLLVTRFGFGKRTSLNEFRPQRRGGQGVKVLKLRTKKDEKDQIISSFLVSLKDDIICVTKNGTVNRQSTAKISSQKRQSQGVIIQRLDKGDEVIDVARIEEADAVIS